MPLLKYIVQLFAWVGSAILQTLLLLLLIVSLLIGTDMGTRLALNTAANFVDLEYQQLEGNFFKRLTISKFRLRSDDTTVTIDTVDWQLDMSGLWQSDKPRQLRIPQLHISGVEVSVPPASEIEPNPKTSSEAFVLSDINLPFGLQADDIRLEKLRFSQGEQTFTLVLLASQFSISQNASTDLNLQLVDGPFESQADLSAKLSLNAQAANAQLVINSAQGRFKQQAIKANGQLQANWDGQTPILNAQQFQLFYGKASATLNGGLSEQQTLSFSAQVPDLSIASPELGGQLSAKGKIHKAKFSDIAISATNITWLGHPQLSTASINSKGTLAEQSLQAQAVVPALGTSPLNLTSTFGWRDTIAALNSALAQPPEALLKSPALHFTSSVKLPNADIVATGMKARNNQLGLTLSEDGGLRLSGYSESGEGQLEMQGALIINDSAKADMSVKAELTGNKYQLANTPELKFVASPSVTAVLAAQTLTVRGEVTVDSGYIELVIPESGAIKPSSDVIIIDDQASAEPPTIINRDIIITLRLPNPIALEGQGFKGSATGELKVTERSGQAPRASGELLLAGQYQAYGQDLVIRRGKLIYVDSPLDDPGVDLEAIRTVNQQIAGVRVSGLASKPTIEIFAEPALSETEALSYLVLGRGLDGNSEEDANRMRSLAISLGLAGSGKILKRYKDRIGVDELSIQTGSNSNDASLLVGRQLSSKLYVSTQIGLFEPVTKFFLRYTLNRRCYFLSETGQQQAADIVCTFKQR